jgi:hypothetical protein
MGRRPEWIEAGVSIRVSFDRESGSGRLVELDAADLEHAAYRLARKCRDEGDLQAAGRWYRIAASCADAAAPDVPVMDGAAAVIKVRACPFGGLSEVMRWQLTAATEHVGTCLPCQKELLDCGGILPAASGRLVRAG